MKKNIFAAVIISLFIVVSLFGCMEERYYHRNNYHSEGYNHRHHVESQHGEDGNERHH
jgi:hypothetical protein